MNDRADLIHVARAYLAEFRQRRGTRANRDFIWWLFDSAQKARRQAQCLPVVVQGELFGGVA